MLYSFLDIRILSLCSHVAGLAGWVAVSYNRVSFSASLCVKTITFRISRASHDKNRQLNRSNAGRECSERTHTSAISHIWPIKWSDLCTCDIRTQSKEDSPYTHISRWCWRRLKWGEYVDLNSGDSCEWMKGKLNIIILLSTCARECKILDMTLDSLTIILIMHYWFVCDSVTYRLLQATTLAALLSMHWYLSRSINSKSDIIHSSFNVQVLIKCDEQTGWLENAPHAKWNMQ